MDIEQADWLAGFIKQIASHLEQSPGLNIEVEGKPELWLQVLLEEDELSTGELGGYILNFPYRDWPDTPLERVDKLDLNLPPGTRLLNWQPDGFVTFWFRPDIPLIPFALLIGDIFQKIIRTETDSELIVQIDYGY